MSLEGGQYAHFSIHRLFSNVGFCGDTFVRIQSASGGLGRVILRGSYGIVNTLRGARCAEVQRETRKSDHRAPAVAVTLVLVEPLGRMADRADAISYGTGQGKASWSAPLTRKVSRI